MANHEGFIQSITEDPGCETSRLVYADWLEEQGRPAEAEYLRRELELARLPLDSPQAPPLRSQLWRAWASVDPAWLRIFTQPRMLRANPTPFPAAWKNFGLGKLRECRGTYGTWPYDSVPALPLERIGGNLDYLRPQEAAPAAGDYQLEPGQTLADAAEKGVRLPGSFVRFLQDPSLHDTFVSVTDCFFTLPDEYSPIQANPVSDGMHVHFYCDSQSCLLWDLYVHPGGGHCVVARWLDYFEPQQEDPEENEPPSTGPRAWFVAPSFEAFLYRVWIENQVWHIEHEDYLRGSGETPPRMTPEIQAYMDHYRQRNAEAEAQP